jgi:hypothetical protein
MVVLLSGSEIEIGSGQGAHPDELDGELRGRRIRNPTAPTRVYEPS